MSALVVFCTCPDAASAEHIARRLVDERLAACVNRVPGLRSVYRWRGEVRDDAEELLVIKTQRARLEALTARILELHPYELPEVIALDVTAGHAPYLAWLARESAAP
ncbi:MAG: divalent-cation tolerance protein CutA [Mizugakiibacter sp.]|uniref:divalent-cation tolerance protein CutA n=1 Tax=Mizugakiibacter sp. TaxID=1972610 RepID=UPI0031BF08B2|nr:divalent-cation tolerance protein CutA [Xanthomonadaceae bacterium]